MALKPETFDDSPDSVRSRLSKEPRVKIKIDETADVSAPGEVFVGVQGYGFKIQRGKAVEVPQSVLRVLEEQFKTIYRVTHDDQGRQTMTPVNIPAYPHQVFLA